MKKSDLIEGEDYAIGSPSRYLQWQGKRATVVEINGARPRANGTTQRGIVLRFAEKAGWSYGSTPAGVEWVLDSARDVLGPWAPYAKRKAEYEAAKRARDAESALRRKVAKDAEVELARRGIAARLTGGGEEIILSADAMTELLAGLPTC